MVAATITTTVNTALPTIEVVMLECSDGETYTSKKFGTVQAVAVSGNADNDAHINAVISASNVVTVNYAGQTDQAVTLVMFGKK
jgi:hypothetical protein